jgi:hypothetical protein
VLVVKRLLVVSIATVALAGNYGIACAQTLRDDFGDDARPNKARWDFATGKVPEGDIWVGVHNATNGGNKDTAALFMADGTDAQSKSRAGRLFIEDLGLHRNAKHNPPGDPLLGVGWEPQNTGQNNAPFLFTSIAADKDFDVVTKLTAQFSGRWSYAAIIIRAAGPPVGRGVGDGLDPAENFITVGSFRPNEANANEASMLLQNTINGATGNPDIIADLAPDGGTGALPIWIRVRKRGGRISAASSVDGNEWLEPSNAVMTNNELNVGGRSLEVGLSYMRFGNPQTPEDTRPVAVFDFFELSGPANASSSPSLFWIAGGAAALLIAVAALGMGLRRKPA